MKLILGMHNGTIELTLDTLRLHRSGGKILNINENINVIINELLSITHPDQVTEDIIKILRILNKYWFIEDEIELQQFITINENTISRLKEKIEKVHNKEDESKEIEQTRRRFRYNTIDKEFKGYEKQFARAFTLYCKIVKGFKEKLINKDLILNGIRTADEIKEFYKEVTLVAKKNGELFDVKWKDFVNLELLGGYTESKEIEDFYDDIKEWLEKKQTHKLITEKGFNKMFKDCLMKVTEDWKIIEIEDDEKDFKDYVVKGDWAINGGSTLQSGKYFDVEKRKNVKLRKTKRLNLIDMEDEELISMAESNKIFESKAVQKTELGKVRAVLNADLSSYIKASWLNVYLEKSIKKTFISNHSTLWLKGKRWIEEQVEIVNRLGETYHVPLDQSEFDHQPTYEMVEMCLDRIFEVCKTSKYGDMIKENLKMQLLNTNVRVGTKKVKYLKGILSGWRWTALLDTLINLVEVEMTKTDEPVSLIAQGDDDQVEFFNQDDAIATARMYSAYNFKINPKKFFISKTRDEYLRQVYEGKNVSGYAARSLPAVLYVKPANNGIYKENVFQQNEIVNAWSKLIGRGCDADTSTKYMIKDLKGLTRLNEDGVKLLMHTPKSFGGCGILPYGDEWIGAERNVEENKFKIKYKPKASKLKKWNITERLLNKMMPNYIDGSRNNKGKTEYKPMEKITTSAKPGGSRTVNLRPRFKESLIPTMILNAKLLEAYDNKDIEQIYVMLSEEGKADFDRLYGKNKRLTREWIIGMKPDIPVILGTSMDYVSTIVYEEVRHIMELALGGNNPNMNYIRQVQLYIGEVVMKRVSQANNRYDVVFGG